MKSTFCFDSVIKITNKQIKNNIISEVINSYDASQVSESGFSVSVLSLHQQETHPIPPNFTLSGPFPPLSLSSINRRLQHFIVINCTAGV